MRNVSFQKLIILIKLGFPIVISQLLHMLIAFTDIVMAGRINSLALSAVAVGNSLWSPFAFFSVGILSALNPIVGHLFGSKDKKNIEVAVQHGLFVSQLIAIVAIISIRYIEELANLIGVNVQVKDLAMDYLIAISWSFPAKFGYSALRCFQEGVGVTKHNMILIIISFFANMFGNYVLMYGKLGFPELGVVGCGYASSFTWWLVFILIIINSKQSIHFKEFHFFRSIKLNWKEFKKIIAIGIPIGFANALELSLFAATTLIVSIQDVNNIAAHHITINIVSITFSIVLGCGIATSIKVSQSLGEKKILNAQSYGYTGIFLCFIIMAVLSIFLYSFRTYLPLIYSNDYDTIKISVTLLIAAALFQIPDGIQVGAVQALRGFKNVKRPLLNNMLSYWVLGIPLCYLLSVKIGYGTIGVWIGLFITLSVSAMLHFMHFKSMCKNYIEIRP